MNHSRTKKVNFAAYNREITQRFGPNHFKITSGKHLSHIAGIRLRLKNCTFI